MISFQRRYQENTKLLTVCKWIADLLIVILLAYTLTLFLCDRTTISGNSMQPAIENEDTVLLNRIAYSFHGPKRYSIIAFHPNGVKTSKIYVKRVIGLPGETIQIHDGKVYINGAELDESAYLNSNVKTEVLCEIYSCFCIFRVCHHTKIEEPHTYPLLKQKVRGWYEQGRRLHQRYRSQQNSLLYPCFRLNHI